MRVVALVVALTLLAVGLYRLFLEERAARRRRSRRAKGDPRNAGARPAPRPSSRSPSAAPAKAPPPRTEPAKAAAEPAHDARARVAPGTAAAVAEAGAAEAGMVDAGARKLPSTHADEADSDEDITIITLAPSPEIVAAMNALAAQAKSAAPEADAASVSPAEPAAALAAPVAIAAEGALPLVPGRIDHPDDEDEPAGDPPSAVPIVYDADASVDEPTRISPLILVSAASQTDQGRRRRRNEDSMLVLEDHHLYVVADGMGGHAGGDVASKMAVEIIGDAFKKDAFEGDPYPDVPRRGGELALAIQMANKAIYEHARANAAYQGMGTTVVSARFSPNKQRVYFGHVGDSRCYRVRGGALTQITTDHTMASQGVTGPLASHLNRAVGVQAGVKVDLIIARPRPDDVYLLCSDGLSKMVPDDEIQGILNAHGDLDKAVQKLVEQANARGGRDNITVVLVQVKDPKGLVKYIQDKASPN